MASLKELSDLIRNNLEISDKHLWTISEGIILAMHSIDIIDDENIRIVIKWIPYSNIIPLWTIRDLSDHLISILDSKPELQSETVWRYVQEYTPITIDYILSSEITLHDFILPDI